MFVILVQLFVLTFLTTYTSWLSMAGMMAHRVLKWLSWLLLCRAFIAKKLLIWMEEARPCSMLTIESSTDLVMHLALEKLSVLS